MSTAMMSQPSRARRTACARPCPRAAPVMKATRPSSPYTASSSPNRPPAGPVVDGVVVGCSAVEPGPGAVGGGAERLALGEAGVDREVQDQLVHLRGGDVAGLEGRAGVRDQRGGGVA